MRWILFILAGLALLDGVTTYANSTTIMQQIAAIMIFVLAGVLFSAAAIVDAVVNLKNEIQKSNPRIDRDAILALKKEIKQ